MYEEVASIELASIDAVANQLVEHQPFKPHIRPQTKLRRHLYPCEQVHSSMANRTLKSASNPDLLENRLWHQRFMAGDVSSNH
jgi:hypothetical protein